MTQQQKQRFFLSGNILPTVLVVCVLILLLVLSVYLIWNGSNWLVAGINYRISGYDDVESAFVLYRNDSTFRKKLTEDGTFLLYDEDPASRIQFKSDFWGLYEKVTIRASKENVSSCRLYGTPNGWKEGVVFYYPDTGSPVTVAGSTVLKGEAVLPVAGIRSSQMGAEFFSGEIQEQTAGICSGTELPKPSDGIYTYLQALLQEPGRLLKSDGTWTETANEISELDYLPADAILIARKISVKKGAVLQGQLLATDTILIGEGAQLQYPSGLYAGGPSTSSPYIELAGGCTVGGYVIVPDAAVDTYASIQYRQSPQSTVSGLVYINGTAKIEGNIRGTTLVRKLVYSAGYEYYPDTFYNAVLEENTRTAYPAWLSVSHLKKEVKWLNVN